MNDSKIMPFCHAHGLKFNRHHMNCVRFAPTETDTHIRAKLELAKVISRRGGTYFTEFPYFRKVPSGKLVKAEADFFWLDELKVVEFEHSYSVDRIEQKCKQFYPLDVLVFDLNEWDKDFNRGLSDCLWKLGLLDRRERSSFV